MIVRLNEFVETSTTKNDGLMLALFHMYSKSKAESLGMIVLRNLKYRDSENYDDCSYRYKLVLAKMHY